MRSVGTLAAVAVALLAQLAACGHDWDALDPRLASGGAGADGVGPGGGNTTSMTSSGGSSGEGGSSAPGGAGGSGSGGMATGGMGPLSFFDNFDRNDDPAIGNGWIEKTPDAFSLVNKLIHPTSVDAGYRNNLVYRPAAEALLDVEASVEFDLTAAAGAPQMFIRAQYATIDTNDVYDGYNIWLSNSPSGATLGRQLGSASSTSLGSITISPPLSVGPHYRLRMRAQGTDPVMVSAFVEEQSGMSWTVIGTASAQDATANRIDSAGAVGFARNANNGFTYDNFRYDEL